MIASRHRFLHPFYGRAPSGAALQSFARSGTRGLLQATGQRLVRHRATTASYASAH